MRTRQIYSVATILFFCLVSGSNILVGQSGVSPAHSPDSLINLIATETDRDSMRAERLLMISEYYLGVNPPKNEAVLREAIEISQEIDYQSGVVHGNANLSRHFNQAGDYVKALEYGLKAKAIQETLADPRGLLISNLSLASIMNTLDRPGEAIDLLLESLPLVDELPPGPVKGAPFFYLGRTYEQIDSLALAEVNYTEALRISEEDEFESGISLARSSLGMLNIKQANYREGIEQLELSLANFESKGQLSFLAGTYFNLAQGYAGIAEYQQASEFISKAIDIDEEQQTFARLSEAYQMQSDYYQQLGRSQEALTALQLHQTFKDSLFSEEKLKITEELQTKYQVEKVNLEKEKAEQATIIAEAESKFSKTLFISTLVGAFLLISIVLLYFAQQRNRKQVEITALELQETQKRLALLKQYRESELKAIKAQMNPHFIFNVLNSVQEYILLNQKQLASDYLGRFADLIRRYLNYSYQEYITLAEEIQTLDLYLELEKLRFDDNFDYTIEAQGLVSADNFLIPTMLIQPYVENAVKHGLLHSKRERILSINFALVEPTLLLCSLKDNGIGRQAAQEIRNKRPGKSLSFSTSATEDRLALLNADRNAQIGVKVNDLTDGNGVANGTEILLTIPVKPA